MTQAYPLQWPQTRARTPWDHRKRASFNKKHIPAGKSYQVTSELSVADAVGRLQFEIDRLGASTYVMSTNLALRLDGLPRSGQAEPEDPGAALYFHLDGKDHCLPCDTYDRIADNIAAIAKHIEATRAIERYGVASMSEMFAGFTAIAAPGSRRSWRAVLGLTERSYPDAPRIVTVETINEAYKRLAKARHPDNGGSDEAMSELNVARAEALQEISR